MDGLFRRSCNVDFNRAGELGGGIHCHECEIKASDCSFEGNRAKGDGGAIRLSYASTADIISCRFTENIGTLPLKNMVYNKLMNEG